MPTNKVLISLCAVIIIGGAIFFTMSKKVSDTPTDVAPIQASNQEASLEANSQVTSEPEKNASSDAIVDYLVDSLSSDVTASAKTTIDAPAPSSQGDTSIQTNF